MNGQERPWLDRVPAQQQRRQEVLEAAAGREDGSCGLVEVFSATPEDHERQHSHGRDAVHRIENGRPVCVYCGEELEL